MWAKESVKAHEARRPPKTHLPGHGDYQVKKWALLVPPSPYLLGILFESHLHSRPHCKWVILQTRHYFKNNPPTSGTRTLLSGSQQASRPVFTSFPLLLAIQEPSGIFPKGILSAEKPRATRGNRISEEIGVKSKSAMLPRCSDPKPGLRLTPPNASPPKNTFFPSKEGEGKANYPRHWLTCCVNEGTQRNHDGNRIPESKSLNWKNYKHTDTWIHTHSQRIRRKGSPRQARETGDWNKEDEYKAGRK